MKKIVKLQAGMLSMTILFSGCQVAPTATTSPSDTSIPMQNIEITQEPSYETSTTTNPPTMPPESIAPSTENINSPTETVPVETHPTTSPTVETFPLETSPSTMPTIETTPQSEDTLDDSQKNSIAMLNYLTVLSQEINDSKNSRLYLEEAYASLINNTNPEKVNDITESQLSSLLDIIEKYRMINVKRDRLKFIYEQNKAHALRNAVPNPLTLLSLNTATNWKKLAASAIYMAVDSYSSYNAYNTSITQEYLRDGWELDDEESANLHDSRKRAFTYMIEIVRDCNIPGSMALNEKSVSEFVRWKNSENIHQRIQFLESEKDTYSSFGPYWLELASCYYENEQYAECLDAISSYKDLHSDIFRKDYQFAKVLPKIIIAAREELDTSEYIAFADEHLKLLNENTENTEWSLKYFAAEMYMDLYAQTHQIAYLHTAYNIILNNVNYLVEEQKHLNSVYLNPVVPITPKEDDTDDEKDQIEEYNDALNEKRECELPPVYAPLVINCDLLFALAERCNISDAEQNHLNGILQGSDPLFLSVPLKAKYLGKDVIITGDISFDKDGFTIPASLVSEESKIKVTVTNGIDTHEYDNWSVSKVDRTGESVETFETTYVCDEISDQEWSENSTVKLEIFFSKSSKKPDFTFNFKVIDYNSWGIFPDSVEFEQVM